MPAPDGQLLLSAYCHSCHGIRELEPPDVDDPPDAEALCAECGSTIHCDNCGAPLDCYGVAMYAAEGRSCGDCRPDGEA